MSFPRRFFGIKIGWEDRGQVESWREEGRVMFEACTECHTRAHVAHQKGDSFIFCPKCLAKLIRPTSPEYLKFKVEK